MNIALLTAQDAKPYRSLMLQAYEQVADAFTSSVEERAAESESWWIERIGGPGLGKAAFGAFLNGELVGSVALAFSRKVKTRHRVQLLGMFVSPRNRGLGVGQALLEAAGQYALARDGVRSIVLTVTDGNAPAMELYRAFGFESFGTEPMAIRTPSGFKAKVHMWKSLVPGDRDVLP